VVQAKSLYCIGTSYSMVYGNSNDAAEGVLNLVEIEMAPVNMV